MNNTVKQKQQIAANHFVSEPSVSVFFWDLWLQPAWRLTSPWQCPLPLQRHMMTWQRTWPNARSRWHLLAAIHRRWWTSSELLGTHLKQSGGRLTRTERRQRFSASANYLWIQASLSWVDAVSSILTLLHILSYCLFCFIDFVSDFQAASKSRSSLSRAWTCPRATIVESHRHCWGRALTFLLGTGVEMNKNLNDWFMHAAWNFKVALK